MILYPNVKLNLGLRILRRRPDGYHDLESLFVPCSAFEDELEIVPSEAFSIDISGPEYQGWDPSEDLAARAWRLLADEYGAGPVSISLVKNSPVGAGLGGGSADGAFALVALNDIFSLGLSVPELAGLASRLGSDCPFFIYNRPMFASGRGEVLEPFGLHLDGYRFEVDVPAGVHVSTREAYSGIDALAGRELPSAPLRDILHLPVERWRGALTNDFEAPVSAAHPEIAAAKQRMYSRGAVYAAMSGSGSAVFGIFAR